MGYWDSPDGSDCFEKTWWTTKAATATGLVTTAYSLAIFQPKTLMEGMLRAGNITLTMASLGAMFGVTTCVATQIRGDPDDALNYFIGGCTTGLLLGVKSRSYATATRSCLAFGTIAALAKVSKREGWVWIPSEPRL